MLMIAKENRRGKRKKKEEEERDKVNIDQNCVLIFILF
jgi:hypothetical protein